MYTNNNNNNNNNYYYDHHNNNNNNDKHIYIYTLIYLFISPMAHLVPSGARPGAGFGAGFGGGGGKLSASDSSYSSWE